MESLKFESENFKEKKEDEDPDHAILFNEFAKKFFALRDVPDMTYKEQDELLTKANDFFTKSQEEKDPAKAKEYLDKYKNYSEEYKKSRQHKYALGNYAPLISVGREFLRETDKVPEKQKSKFMQQLKDIDNLIDKERAVGTTPDIVNKVVEFVKNLQKYTNG